MVEFSAPISHWKGTRWWLTSYVIAMLQMTLFVGFIKFGGEHRFVSLNLDLSLNFPLLNSNLGCWREDSVIRTECSFSPNGPYTPPKIVHIRVSPITSITLNLRENGDWPPRKSTPRGKGLLFSSTAFPILLCEEAGVHVTIIISAEISLVGKTIHIMCCMMNGFWANIITRGFSICDKVNTL